MKNTIGIRHEDKYKMERRVALIPAHIKSLVQEKGIDFKVQTSAKRIFTDTEYQNAGAEITDNLKEADVIMGVKEIPLDFFERNKTYIFFSHVIKGQEYNMPMLKKMMELECNLIDYEKVEDENGRRLIFFGRFAGLAGMINSLWTLGERLKRQGIENPFSMIKQSYQYTSLEEAKEDVKKAAEAIKKDGIPEELTPLTIGFTGYGNVSNGAQEIADILPHNEISPEALLSLKESGSYSNKEVYKIIFKEKNISRLKENSANFELQDYYDNPDKYENNFEQFVPHLTVLMNCMYWDANYPRIITIDFMENLYKNHKKLIVVGDVTCDPDGSIEFTHKGTPIDNPVFIYNPLKKEAKDGFEGEGIAVMAVDILPSELPKESSEAFSAALYPFIESIAKADFSQHFKEIELAEPIKKAMILSHGKLTEDYQYIEEFL